MDKQFKKKPVFNKKKIIKKKYVPLLFKIIGWT